MEETHNKKEIAMKTLQRILAERKDIFELYEEAKTQRDDARDNPGNYDEVERQIIYSNFIVLYEAKEQAVGDKMARGGK